jgi:predicted permease
MRAPSARQYCPHRESNNCADMSKPAPNQRLRRPGSVAVMMDPVNSIQDILIPLAPIFALIGLGVVLRRARWLSEEADKTLLGLGVNLFFPSLIFSSVVGIDALHQTANLLWPPLLGFAWICLGWLASWPVGRAIGLERGSGLRTFAFTTGFPNYSYLPIAIITALFPPATLGVLFVFTVGVDFAVWTIGILLLAGGTAREGWKKLRSPPVLALIAAVALNLLGLAPPASVLKPIAMLGNCAVPLGLLLIGAIMDEHLREPRSLLSPRVNIAAVVLRLGALPLALLAAARWLPLSTELRQVLVVQAAMPVGVFPVVLTKHYGGRPLIAARIVLATTVVSLVSIPLWMRWGLSWLGR